MCRPAALMDSPWVRKYKQKSFTFCSESFLLGASPFLLPSLRFSGRPRRLPFCDESTQLNFADISQTLRFAIPKAKDKPSNTHSG